MTNKYKYFGFILFLLSLNLVVAQTINYKRVKIFASNQQLQTLANKGIAVDHGTRKANQYLITELSSEELQILNSLNVNYEILIDDLQKYYEHQNDGIDIKSLKNQVAADAACNNFSSYPTPQNFNLGSYAGFFTYQEMLDNLDSMAAKYPNIIKTKSPIDTMHTIQGRPVYWLKISDNPNTVEPEPQILYNAVHHAREPASMSQLIFYMWYLLEHYNTNPDIKYLVDNTEMYFIPCVNPDGYLYNEINSPNSGGMWRKNRRLNAGGTIGVDLNRNYGYMWGSNVGSSPNSNSDTYRGPSPFSEPETKILKFMCETHHFITAINAHTYGNDLIYPWGHQTDSLTPDSTLFEKWGMEMVKENGYKSGLGTATIGYYTNGDSDDWMYGEQNTKPKIFSMTPELGSDNNINGFYPPANQIIGISQNGASLNLMAAKLITSYAQVVDKSPYNITTNSYYQKLSVERLGYDSTASYTVSIAPLQNVVSAAAQLNYAHLNLFDLHLDSIQLTLVANMQDGDAFSFVINTYNGVYTHHDTITKVFGNGGNLFSDICSNTSNWNSGTSWGNSTTVYHSAPSSITDSPIGNYADNASSEIILSNPINLQNVTSATLNFWAKWNIELGFDFAQVLASSDNGATWQALCGNYTKNGSANQDFNKPIYDGVQFDWVQESMSLDAFVGQNILIKYKIASDQGTIADGFYFDDVTVKVYGDSTVDVQGLNENDFVVFPNPAKDNLVIQFKESCSSIISIYDICGNEIFSKTNNSVTQNIDISSFASGLYSLKIINSKTGTSFKKLISKTD